MTATAYTQHHLDFLAKLVGMDVLASIAGRGGEKKIDPARLERDPKKRRDVILDLAADGYLGGRSIGEKTLPVTTKALTEYLETAARIDYSAFHQPVQISTRAQPLPTYLPIDVIAVIINGLQEGALRAEMVEGDLIDKWIVRVDLAMVDQPVALTMEEEIAELKARVAHLESHLVTL